MIATTKHPLPSAVGAPALTDMTEAQHGHARHPFHRLHPPPRATRRKRPWLRLALSGVVILLALALVALYVARPLLDGLPVGWGIYTNQQFHLSIGTPRFWTASEDSVSDACSLVMADLPTDERAPVAEGDWLKIDQAIFVFAMLPCSTSGPFDPAGSWQSTGRTFSVAGRPVTLYQSLAPNVGTNYLATFSRGSVNYTFYLQQNLPLTSQSAARFQQNLSYFETVLRSYRYM